ncbi:RNA-polymerase II-associated protein 3-like, C-terminal domain,Tetratricopeptide repeat,Tetratricopeptide [Cinara cedri]|uniref:RNA-polymerase II-associated protein 3-like, C-terminal domain,Tetratricopeptide repeat,Tetratricopeptide n=1 Tax=Cinara cedri TaxID=506608 RepID=A0A5E4MEW6_9HEMI|nr:RNA-polymerase II-associated protein 3-like, C-terminal domain,Tetratricopeptide repeat,Tetratricopeptide [Cinara cedri]
MAINQNQPLSEKYGIPLNHLDFSYLKECEDPKELKHIIKILESGEEGNYPPLLSAAEERLREIKPDASILNRKLCFAKKSSDFSNSKDYNDVFGDINKWIKQSQQQEKDSKLEKQNLTDSMNDHDKQPVRDFVDLTLAEEDEGKPTRNLSIPRIHNLHNEPLEASYSKWDKYDPDVELMKLENKAKTDKLQADIKENLNSNLSFELNDTLSIQDRVKSLVNKNANFRPQDLAKREKELGNECFKSNDYEEALRHYNTSIEIHPTPEAKNNRAMSFIKLNKFEEALDDLREVIESDPRNIKAHFRRGSCFKAISMYCLALRSFEVTLKYDCNNAKALILVKELKHLISNIPSKKLIRVREITRHYDETVWDIEDPFRVSYPELSELKKERVEYLYEADSFGCLTECVCHLCPWHEWQQRKKKLTSRHRTFKNDGQRKRWEFLTSNNLPILVSNSVLPDLKRPKRLNVIEINSAKMNGHGHTNTTVKLHNGFNGIDKSPCKECDNDDMMLGIKPVSNVYEFLQCWKTASQKNNYELYQQLLRSIKPKDLPKVISTNLDEEIMSKFLETLNQKFNPDTELDLIVEYLTAMTKVNRFSLIVGMLDNKVKEGIQPLLKRVHHYTNSRLFMALL